MNIQTLTALLGKAINSPEMVNFLEENGFKYPKKDTISNKKEDKTYWIENKKLKIDLLFSIVIHNENFHAVPAEKKGVFYPILTNIRIYGDNIDLPYGIILKKETTYDAMVSRVVNPAIKSSDIASIWLNDDGSESWYRWNINIETDKIMTFELHDDNMTHDFWVRLEESEVLFYLYDELFYENFDSFTKNLNHRDVAALMFVRWAIESDLMIISPKNKEIISMIKNAKNNNNELIFDFIKIVGRGVIYEEDFITDRQNDFRKYINNIDVENYYYDDFCKLFLGNKKLSYDEQDKKLDEVAVFTEENYQKIENMLDDKFLSC